MDRNTLLIALPDVAGATTLDRKTVLELAGRKLFPAPIHLKPLLWRESEVRRWVSRAAYQGPRCTRAKSQQ